MPRKRSRVTVAWLPTNTKMVSTSLAFKQTTLAIGIYVTVYLALVAFALRNGLLQLFNYNYLPLEVWIFYNLIITGILLWTMYRTMEGRQVQRVGNTAQIGASLLTWQLSTAGLYVALSR